MKKEDIPRYVFSIKKIEYIEKCDNCGEEISCYAQVEIRPDDYTKVYIKCKCGDYKEFNLPFN